MHWLCRRLCLGLLCVNELTVLSEVLECGEQDLFLCDEELQSDAGESELSLIQKNAEAQHLSRPPSSNNISVSMSNANGSESNGSLAQTHDREASASPYEQLYTMMLAETQSSMSKKWIIIIACCVGAFFLGAISTVVILVETIFSKFLGELIASGIDFIAEEILGLDISFGSMTVGICRGYVLIEELMIANPPGWQSDHFLEIKTFSVRANLWRLVLQYYMRGIEDVDVNLMLIKDLDLAVEKSWLSSNVHDILKIVKGETTKPKLRRKVTDSALFEKGRMLESAIVQDVKAAGTSLKAAELSCTKDPADHAEKKDGMRECEFTVHQLTLADIGATVPLLGRVVVPTIQYDDFDSEFEGNARTVRSILTEITKALLEKAITLHMK